MLGGIDPLVFLRRVQDRETDRDDGSVSELGLWVGMENRQASKANAR
jgi:hypothetical protein